VVEAAVVGQPDPDMGQRIAAFVVLAPGFVEHPPIGEEIRATVRGLLAPYKTPHVVTVVESLPKSPVGKILRRALR
jgi:acyl-coenzyme A synthetase/AMP-(fatty) acid ligase